MKTLFLLLFSTFLFGESIQERYISDFNKYCSFDNCKEIAEISSALDDKTLEYVIENKYNEFFFKQMEGHIESSSIKFALYEDFIIGIHQYSIVKDIFKENNSSFIISQKSSEKFENSLYNFFCGVDRYEESNIKKRNYTFFYFLRNYLGSNYISFVGSVKYAEKKEDLLVSGFSDKEFFELKEYVANKNKDILKGFISGFVFYEAVNGNLNRNEIEKLIEELSMEDR